MSWISLLLTFLVFDNVTGAVVSLLSLLLLVLCWRYLPHSLSYMLVKVSTLSFLFPIGYIWMFLEKYERLITLSILTTEIDVTYRCMCIWRNVMAFLLVSYIVIIANYKIRMRKYYREARAEYVEKTHELCELFGVKKKVRVYESEKCISPYIEGFFKCKIVLPAKDIEDDALTLVLLHELYHNKNKDNLWRTVADIIAIFNWPNIFAWINRFNIERWAEVCCDDKCNEIYGRKSYYSTILNQIEESDYEAMPQDSSENNICEGIGDSFDVKYSYMKRRLHKRRPSRTYKELKWRIRMMRTRKNLLVSVLAVVVLIYASGTVTLAASKNINEKLLMYYFSNDEVAYEDEYVPPTEYEEYETDEPLTGYETTVYNLNFDGSRSNATNYTFNIKPGALAITSAIYKGSGTTIFVNGYITPTNVPVQVGIVRPDGTRLYINATRDFSHTFNCIRAGQYQFYILNTSSTAVQVNGVFVK